MFRHSSVRNSLKIVENLNFEKILLILRINGLGLKIYLRLLQIQVFSGTIQQIDFGKFSENLIDYKTFVSLTDMFTW